ncbi:MAG: hypothetical protein U0359_04705 [Byssovorax sp.]
MWSWERVFPAALAAGIFVGLGCGGGQIQGQGAGKASFDGTFPSVACVRTSCAASKASCGFISDGCGDFIECGGVGVTNTGCPEGPTCGGSTPNQCSPGACTPITDCGDHDCGSVNDGCDNTISCGSCTFPEVCGAAGPNKCGKPAAPAVKMDGDAVFERQTDTEFGLSGSVSIHRDDRDNVISFSVNGLSKGKHTGLDLAALDAELTQDGPDSTADFPKGTLDITIEDFDCHGSDCLARVTATAHIPSSPVFTGDITFTAEEQWVEDTGGGSSGCGGPQFPIPSK